MGADVCVGNVYSMPPGAYELSSDQKNWSGAKVACEALGMRLAKIESDAEEAQLWLAVQSGSTVVELAVWIGLTDGANECATLPSLPQSQAPPARPATRSARPLRGAAGAHGCGLATPRCRSWGDTIIGRWASRTTWAPHRPLPRRLPPLRRSCPLMDRLKEMISWDGG